MSTSHDVPGLAPVVSVLVLAYNHEHYVAEALDSILAQDFAEPMEILVGEDQSTDGTMAIVREFERANPGVVRVISSDTNVGMLENHRRLLRASRGQFVAYCEGDDSWHDRSKLTRQIEMLRHLGAHSGVHSDVDHLIDTPDGHRVQRSYWGHHRSDRRVSTSFNDLLVENVVQTCSVVLRGEVARRYPDSPLASERFVVDDWPLFLHAAMHGPLGYDSRSLATYRRVTGSATNQGPAAAELRLADQERLILTAHRIHPGRADAVAEGLLRSRWSLLLTALRAGDTQMARRWAGRHPAGGPRRLTVRLTIGRLVARLPGAVPVAGRVIRAAEAHIETRDHR